MIQVPLRALMAMIPAFVLTILLFLGGNALLRVYTDSTAYPAYMETLDLSEGSVGSTPTADTPLAKTVADMESMDTFTIIGAVAWDRPLPLDGQRYYEVEIKTDQGYTTFLARINKDASERLETGGVPSAGGFPWRRRTLTACWTGPITWISRTITPIWRGISGRF